MARYTEWLQKKFVGDPKLGAEYLSLARTLLGGLRDYSKGIMSNVRHVTLPNGVKITVGFAGAINRVMIDVRDVVAKTINVSQATFYARPSWSGLFDYAITVSNCGVRVVKVSRKPRLKYLEIRLDTLSDVFLTDGQNIRNTYCVTSSNNPQYFNQWYEGSSTKYIPTRINGHLAYGWGLGFFDAGNTVAVAITNSAELAVLKFDRGSTDYNILYFETSTSSLLSRAQQTRVVFNKAGNKFAYFDKLNSLVVRELYKDVQYSSGYSLTKEVTFPLSSSGGVVTNSATGSNSFSYHAVGPRLPIAVIPWYDAGDTYIHTATANNGTAVSKYDKIPIACDFDAITGAVVVLYATEIVTTVSSYAYNLDGEWSVTHESGGCGPYPTTYKVVSISSSYEKSTTSSQVTTTYKLHLNNKEIFKSEKTESSSTYYDKTFSAASTLCCCPIIGNLYCDLVSSNTSFESNTISSSSKLGDTSIPYLISFDLRYSVVLVFDSKLSVVSSSSAAIGDDLIVTTETTDKGTFKLYIGNALVDVYEYVRPKSTVVDNTGAYSPDYPPVEGDTGDIDTTVPVDTSSTTEITQFTKPYYGSPSGDKFNSMAELFVIDETRALVYIRDQDNNKSAVFLVCDGAAVDITARFDELPGFGSARYLSIVSAYTTLGGIDE